MQASNTSPLELLEFPIVFSVEYFDKKDKRTIYKEELTIKTDFGTAFNQELFQKRLRVELNNHDLCVKRFMVILIPDPIEK